jgi:glycosyltransferase involved in cell wall biosynthesis
MPNLTDHRVSVIIPLHNSAPYIVETLDSLCQQTYVNWEAILINDGSTDETLQTIEPYLKDGRFKYLRQKNQGVAVARNSGLKIATGDWICLLDHDDRWMATKLERQIEFAAANGCDIVCTDAVISNGPVKTLYSQEAYFQLDLVAKSKWDKRIDLFELLIQADFLCASSVMLRKSLFDELGLFDEKAAPADDYEMWLRCAPSAHIGYLNEPLVEYVLHNNNCSHDIVKIKEKGVYALYKNRKRFLSDRERLTQFDRSILRHYKVLFEKLADKRGYRKTGAHLLLLSYKGRYGLRLIFHAAVRPYLRRLVLGLRTRMTFVASERTRSHGL